MPKETILKIQIKENLIRRETFHGVLKSFNLNIIIIYKV
jgi:hypothetical protein